MSVIHQMYCTHCTHGSSALERRQGEIAARMLGYSVRASSLEGDPLKQAYRQVERYVSYHLPKDTPSEQKLQLTAATAPKRLIFVPAAGPLQVIGQVCYRGRDTEGRPGSYFAHLLCRDADSQGERWNLLDALRLWQAPNWVAEDSPEHPFVLPALNSLEELAGDQQAHVNDRKIVAFLRGDDRSFGTRLPDRWRDLAPTRRTETLKKVLSALVNVGTTRRQAVIVAVEPEVAALLFYAVGRLLPPGELRESVSMSTFESATDRLTTTLAATTFANPATVEFRADSLRGRGIVVNTFSNMEADPEAASAYVERMIRRLLEKGPDVVDQSLEMLAASKPERIETLDDFAGTEEAIRRLFQAKGGKCELPWRSDPCLTDFARRLTWERLAAIQGTEATLDSLCGRQNHMIVLELAGTVAPGTEIDRAYRYLLKKLPEEKIAPFVAHPEVDETWKIELLQSHICARGKTPRRCEWVWDEDEQQTPLNAEQRDAIAVGVIAHLPASAAVALLTGLNAQRRLVAAERLFSIGDDANDRWNVFAEVVRRLDAGSLIGLWQRLEDRLFEVPAPVGKAISERLHDVLNTLHEHAAEFSQRLNFLQAGRRWLDDSNETERLAAWTDCRDAMVELIAMKEPSGWTQLTANKRLEVAAQCMTEAAIQAMPPESLEDDRQGGAKQERLRAIGRHLAGGEEFLPTAQWQYEAIWKKIGWRIEMGSWPSAPLRKLARGPAQRQQIWIAAGIAALVILGVLAIFGLAKIGTVSSNSQGLVVERAATRTQQEGEAAADSIEVSTPPEPDGLSDGALSQAPLGDGEQEPGGNEGVSEPIVFRRGPIENEPTEEIGAPDDRVHVEKPLVTIDGSFAANMSSIADLKPPVVALVALQVCGADGNPLPEWVLTQYTIGAVVREQSDLRVARNLDFEDLTTKDEAELHDGVEKVLVQFRFVRKPRAVVSESGVTIVTSYSWAEVPIEPARRYDIRFALAPSAITELRSLAAEEE